MASVEAPAAAASRAIAPVSAVPPWSVCHDTLILAARAGDRAFARGSGGGAAPLQSGANAPVMARVRVAAAHRGALLKAQWSKIPRAAPRNARACASLGIGDGWGGGG